MRPCVDFGKRNECLATIACIGIVDDVVENRSRGEDFAGIREARRAFDELARKTVGSVGRERWICTPISVEEPFVRDATLAMELPVREAQIGGDGCRIVALNVDPQENRGVASVLPRVRRWLSTVYRAQCRVHPCRNGSQRTIEAGRHERVVRERIAAQLTSIAEVAQKVTRRAVVRASGIGPGHGPSGYDRRTRILLVLVP